MGRQREFEFRTWGGKRKGSGRKPTGARAGVEHRPREIWAKRMPVHVTLRMAPEVWNLRSGRAFRWIERALLTAVDRFDVGVTSFSVQGNHIHLLAEAPDPGALSQAIKGLSIRIAKGLNTMMKRSGSVFADRFHAHVLRTPPEVRNAIRYIRDNAKKHAAERGETYSSTYVDPYSSSARPDLTVTPRTWLLREGWKPRPPRATSRTAQPR